MKKKITGMALLVCCAVGFMGCSTGGKTDSRVDKTYQVSYDNTLPDDELDAIPEYQFLPLNLKNMVTYGMAINVTLDLDKDGTYTLTAKDHNVDETVKEGGSGYVDISLTAEGTYEKSGDEVTIGKPEKADYTYNCNSTITDQEMFAPLSFHEDHSGGSWSSKEKPELLSYVPETVFTVNEDGEIETWKKK